jgi:hypothetical protein
MTREKLLDALRASDEENTPLTEWWDEYVTIVALVDNASYDQIKQAWADVNLAD